MPVAKSKMKKPRKKGGKKKSPSKKPPSLNGASLNNGGNGFAIDEEFDPFDSGDTDFGFEDVYDTMSSGPVGVPSQGSSTSLRNSSKNAPDKSNDKKLKGISYPDKGRLSDVQIAAAMIDGGFPADEQVLAEGIATVHGEQPAGGWVKGRNFAGCCVGGWQINIDAHAVSETCAASVRCSTKEAYKLWAAAGGKGSGFCPPNPWQAGVCGSGANRYRSSARKAIEAGGGAAAAAGASGGAANAGGGLDLNPFDAVAEVAGAIAAVGKLIARLFEPDFWLRSGKVILGVLALAAAVVILGKAILGIDIGGMIPIGKAARAVAGK